MRKILVTGGAGFLGSNLCERLVSEGCEVICVDNFYTGRRDNIKNLIDNAKFKLIEHDIVEPLEKNSYFTNNLLENISEVYNLACPASPPKYQKHPTKTVKTSVLGMINLLDLAVKYNFKILQASTSEVYGDAKVHPQVESYNGNVNPVGIRACYDEGKRCAETLCFDYSREFGANIKVVRIFNTYGPNMDPDDGRVISNFIVQALKNQNITIYGNGLQTRSFCYVDDLIDGIILTMRSNDDFLGPVNIGNPSEYQVLEIAKIIIAKIKSHSKIIYLPLPADDPMQRKPNIELAREKLKWCPTVTLEEGLFKTIEYYQSFVDLSKSTINDDK